MNISHFILHHIINPFELEEDPLQIDDDENKILSILWINLNELLQAICRDILNYHKIVKKGILH